MLPKKIKPGFFDALSNVTGRYVKPAPYRKATGLVAEVYDRVVDEFFINAPLTTHSLCPEVLAGVWMAERENLLTDHAFTREDKEAPGVTISQVNGCAHCEDLGNSVVYGANEGELAEQLRHHEQSRIPDEITRSLHEWALNSYNAGSEILGNPPFSKTQAPEVIGSAFMLNYFNLYVQVFFTGTPLKAPFQSHAIKSALYRLTGVELRESVIRRLEPGRATKFLPAAEPPDDMRWAVSNTHIAEALSRWAAVMDESARQHVSSTVRDVVGAKIAAWRGEPMGLSRAWTEPHVAGLDLADAAAARLALVTAFAPAQMGDSLAEGFRSHFKVDVELVMTVAGAAFSASRRVAGWLAERTGYFEGQSLGEVA